MSVHKPSHPAPAHLASPTRQWWEAVVAEYVLDEHHLKLLTAAAEAWDRYQAAREAIAQHGTTYIDRFGAPRLHPECVVERDSRLAFARLLKELSLDDADMPPRQAGRQPGVPLLNKGKSR